jgi:transcriptional regulator with XRE-family HTH domain
VKKQRSLRQQARELGVSHSYLSQVLHGKRPPSDRVALALSGKQLLTNSIVPRDLKSASCKGVWVRVPPSAVNVSLLLNSF